jgi:hypothetical protein
MGADGWPTVEPTSTKFQMEAFQQSSFAGK